MDLQINGLRVLVTAGAAGIGLKTVQAFLREGAKVHACDVDQAALATVGKSHPEVTVSRTDVSDRAAVAKLLDDALAALGGLDCLVNNAGIAGPTGRVDEIDPDDWDRTLAVDITGTFNCTRVAVPHIRKSRNGSIINLSSSAGKFGFPLRSPYSAAKWGVVGVTKTWAMELGEFGVRVNAVLPGIVEGDRIRRVFDAKAKERGVPVDELLQNALRQASIKELVQPTQLADMIVFLASPLARTVSGQAISVDADLQSLVG
ncbi:MAG TPA: SDR family oxidoreductase [Beijerinckiaceae bacterium]|nr:SDR family oxidoreductase [Beijerinckiaceae bacterium]